MGSNNFFVTNRRTIVSSLAQLMVISSLILMDDRVMMDKYWDGSNNIIDDCYLSYECRHVLVINATGKTKILIYQNLVL